MIVENETKSHIALTFGIQIINYLEYSFIIPLVLFYATIFGFIVVTILGLFDIYNQNLLAILFEIFFKIFRVPDSVSGNISVNMGTEDILKIYGFLSLIFYLIGVLIEQLFKIKLSLSLRKKIKTTIFINILLSLLVFFIIYFVMKSPITTCLLMFLGLILFGIIATVFSSVAYVLEKMASYIQKSV